MKNKNPIRLAFDQQIFSLQVYGGISRYFVNLAQQLSCYKDIKMRVIAPLFINSYLKSLDSSKVLGVSMPILPKTGRLRSVINRLIAPIQMKSFNPDVVHETYYSFRSYAPPKAARVITVYDMTHEKYSELLPQSNIMTAVKRFAVNRADHIICISENTRQDLLNLFNIPEHKTSTVHLGFNLLDRETDHIYLDKENYHGKPYLLYVGNRYGYKNFKGLLEAYASSELLRNNLNIICFGGEKFSIKEKKKFSEYNLSDNQVIQMSGNDTELIKYYQQATAFIYPSFYEGFGIPLLEAMAFDCPVICSNTSSLPEVAGNAAEYFNPKNLEEITQAIERVVNSNSYRTELIKRGRVRCKQFSWKKCAEKTYKVYRSLL